MTIFTAILALLIAIGGIIPPVAEGIARDRLSRALNHPQKLEFQLRSTPSIALAWAHVDRVYLLAEEFEVQGLPVRRLELATSPVTLDAGAALSGTPRLRDPMQAEARLDLTEDALNAYLQTETIKTKLANLKLNLGELPGIGSLTDIQVGNLKLSLLEDRAIVNGTLYAMGGFMVIPVEIGGKLKLQTNETLALENPSLTVLGNVLPADQVATLLSQYMPVIDLQKFAPAGIDPHLSTIQVKAGQISLSGWADIREIPGFPAS